MIKILIQAFGTRGSRQVRKAAALFLFLRTEADAPAAPTVPVVANTKVTSKVKKITDREILVSIKMVQSAKATLPETSVKAPVKKISDKEILIPIKVPLNALVATQDTKGNSAKSALIDLQLAMNT